MRQEGVDFILDYLDDLLLVGALASQECTGALTTLLSVFDRLGLPVAMDKLEGSCSQLAFLGFEFDSTRLAIRIPQGKLTELQQLIQAWMGRTSCTVRELDSLVGKFGHAARVVSPGQTIVHRMFELLARVQQSHHQIRLSMAFRSDLQWWSTYLGTWNRVTMMHTLTPGQRPHHVWAHTSGHFGCGTVYPASRSWLQLLWLDLPSQGGMQLQVESILLQELLPIILACTLWGPQ